MKSIENETSATAYSGWHAFKPINFYCHAPEAKSVHFAGDFNQWTPVAMRQRPEGWWFLQVELTHGHHLYRFLVDGKPTLDPRATGVSRDEANEAVSIIAVSLVNGQGPARSGFLEVVASITPPPHFANIEL